jgi:hypothetical protein
VAAIQSPQLYQLVGAIATSLARDMGATVATEACCLSIRNRPTLVAVLVRRSLLVQGRLASEEQPIRLSAQFGYAVGTVVDCQISSGWLETNSNPTIAQTSFDRFKPLSKTENERYWRIDEVSKIFAKFENNFTLQEIPRGWR